MVRKRGKKCERKNPGKETLSNLNNLLGDDKSVDADDVDANFASNDGVDKKDGKKQKSKENRIQLLPPPVLRSGLVLDTNLKMYEACGAITTGIDGIIGTLNHVLPCCNCSCKGLRRWELLQARLGSSVDCCTKFWGSQIHVLCHTNRKSETNVKLNEPPRITTKNKNITGNFSLTNSTQIGTDT